MSDGTSHSHSRKQYWIIFGLLFVLTVAEVALAQTAMAKSLLVGGLVALALAKATLVALFFMHLKTEMKALKLTVFLPFIFPALYAFFLIWEAGVRHA